MVATITIYGIASIVAVLLAALIAPRRGRNWDAWAFAGFLFPPAVLLLLLLPKGAGVRRLTEDEKLLKTFRDNGS